MKYAVAFALLLTHATAAQPGLQNVDMQWQAPSPPQDFETNCIVARDGNNWVFQAGATGCYAAGLQNTDMEWQAPSPPQPYTRDDFKQDCIKLAKELPPHQRAAWIAACRKDAP